MSVTIRQINLDDKLCHHFHLSLMQDRLPDALIWETLTRLNALEQREKKLNMFTVVTHLIGIGLYPHRSLQALLRDMSSPLRTLGGQERPLWSTSAFCQRRAQLPVKVLQSLFQQIACPLASAQTPGALWRGYRLMGIDSTLEDVADTPANARFFGRLTSGKSRSPFPQVRCTALVECGTHAVVDACLTPCKVGEMSMARRLVRSVTSGMLVLMDRGFRSLQLLQGIKRKGSEVLALVPTSVLHHYDQQLPDGSWLATYGGRNCQDEPLPVRVLEYSLTVQDLPGPGTTYRLLTTCLDPEQAPASELIPLYKERWPVETTFGEIDKHQQIERTPLRSRSPLAVLQELYAVLIGHFLLRDLMHQAVTLPGEPPLAPDQLSYQSAVSCIATTLTEALWLAPCEQAALKHRLLLDLRAHRLPTRTKTVRIYPRALKRIYLKFPQKRPEQVPILRSDLTWSSLFSLS